MSVASHYDGSASSYGDQYDPDRIWTNTDYPANFFRLELVRRLLKEARASSVYELGIGDGTPLVRLAADGLRVAVIGGDAAAAVARGASALPDRKNHV